MMRNPHSQVDTPAFKRWFGNSKVVDDKGNPLVVYHGTDKAIHVFDPRVGINAPVPNSVYFSDDPNIASWVAKNRGWSWDVGGKVIAAYLRIENPLVIDAEGAHAIHLADRVASLLRRDHDGVIIKNVREFFGDEWTTTFAVFSPTQIKSATGNRGTFDPSDPDIRHNPRRNPRLVANPYKDKILLPSGNVQYIYSEQDVAKRHAEKAQRIEQLKTKEQRLRSAVKRDTEAGDPVATAVALIMATYERVGNNESAAEGHFGVTGWQARHFTRDGSKYRIDYVGKSGVEQTKVIDQPWLVQALAQHLRKKRKNERVLPVSASTVNRYLEEYDVSAKDLRGYGANTEMQKELTRLRKRGPALATLKPKDVIKTLKAEFSAALTVVASKLGHTTSVLRKQYLVPALEPMYIESGAVLRTFA
jgi:hypothetical protein